jgi:hypothetical protein
LRLKFQFRYRYKPAAFRHTHLPRDARHSSKSWSVLNN